jgi:hypothetical protein
VSRHIQRPSLAFGVLLTALLSVLLIPGCGDSNSAGGFVAIGSNNTFVDAPDGGSDAGPVGAICPAKSCPNGRTTCGNSQHPCDVDLRRDPNNCGACGIECPKDIAEGRLGSGYLCESGKCKIACASGRANCNGLIEDGCETVLSLDINHCGACGNKCTDTCRGGSCGCPAGQTFCGTCKDTRIDDNHCGMCNNRCPSRTQPPLLFHAGYRCVGSQCGVLRCDPGWLDCNGDLLMLPAGNGCEVRSGTSNCGSCGNACLLEERCDKGVCVKPPVCSNNACGDLCTNISTDAENCGACFNQCPKGDPNTNRPLCTNGVCGLTCNRGRADCDGIGVNGCETNTGDDPLNCGGCGIQCDNAIGQPCIDGVCAVEFCKMGPR